MMQTGISAFESDMTNAMAALVETAPIAPEISKPRTEPAKLYPKVIAWPEQKPILKTSATFAKMDLKGAIRANGAAKMISQSNEMLRKSEKLVLEHVIVPEYASKPLVLLKPLATPAHDTLLKRLVLLEEEMKIMSTSHANTDELEQVLSIVEQSLCTFNSLLDSWDSSRVK